MDRETAIKLGLKKFLPDRPCHRGHKSERYTSSGGCVACHKLSTDAVKEKCRKARAEHNEQIARSIGLVRLVLYLSPRDAAAVRKYVDELHEKGK